MQPSTGDTVWSKYVRNRRRVCRTPNTRLCCCGFGGFDWHVEGTWCHLPAEIEERFHEAFYSAGIASQRERLCNEIWLKVKRHGSDREYIGAGTFVHRNRTNALGVANIKYALIKEGVFK